VLVWDHVLVENAALIPLSNMARRLHVTCAWLRNQAERGRVPALNADGRLLFHPPAVEKALLEMAVAKPVEEASNARR
jgi:hypothetical protein